MIICIDSLISPIIDRPSILGGNGQRVSPSGHGSSLLYILRDYNKEAFVIYNLTYQMKETSIPKLKESS